MAAIERTVFSDHHAAYPDDFSLQGTARDAINSDYFVGRALNYLRYSPCSADSERHQSLRLDKSRLNAPSSYGLLIALL